MSAFVQRVFCQSDLILRQNKAKMTDKLLETLAVIKRNSQQSAEHHMWTP